MLMRTDQAPARSQDARGRVPHPEELALARRLLGPYIEKIISKGTDIQKAQALMVLAQVDPAQTLELLDAHSSGEPQVAVDSLRSLSRYGMASQSPDEAVSIAESIADLLVRSWA